jgi:outer membrane protein OmpA-like peptidoglycan-associated protein
MNAATIPLRTVTRIVSPALIPALVLGLAIACATPPSPALERARARHADAAADPIVTSNASVELYEAEQAVDRAERAWERDAEHAEVERLAEIAELRVATAEQVAQRRSLEQRAEELGSQRSDLRLAARDRRIDDARATAREQAARAEVESERADAASERADEAEERLTALEEDLESAASQGGAVVLTLDDVLFAFGGVDLQPGAQRALDRVAEFLKAHPDRTVSIEGHTDDVGDASSNQMLSERRARAVADYLRNQGVDANRLQAVGYGESRPLVANQSASARQQNRRVEIVIEEQQASLPARQSRP